MHPTLGQSWRVRRFANMNDVHTGLVLGTIIHNGRTLYKVKFSVYGDTAYLPRDRFYSHIPPNKKQERKARASRIIQVKNAFRPLTFK